MKIRVLGSGAGGGFPQWNCNCRNCAGVRRGDIQARRRTQSSIAASSDGRHWVLFNASPDIRTQLEAFEAAWPQAGIRDSGIKAIVLIDSQIDHTTGLLTLRESTQPLEIWCSEMVRQDLTTGFPLFNMLEHYCKVNHHPVPLDGSAFTIPGIEDLRFHSHALKSKAPPYSPHRHDPHPGDNIGILMEQVSTGRKLYYAPGLGEIEPHVYEALRLADCVLVDGTFWQHDEMSRAGICDKRALDMGHLPQSGPGGMIETLASIGDKRKVLIHINNTNPILDESSPERQALAAAGIEVAQDGMDIEL
jgi:pyrroloquinoline quinone biosynthesis protein B